MNNRADPGWPPETPVPGPACLTFDTHTATMDAQENVVLVGAAAPESDGRVRVQVDRALTDWSITGNRVTRALSFLANGRELRPRLAAEAASWPAGPRRSPRWAGRYLAGLMTTRWPTKEDP